MAKQVKSKCMRLVAAVMLTQSVLAQALFGQSQSALELGNGALEAKQYDRAIELFSKAAAEDPKDYGAEFQLALTYNLIGKDREAISHYQNALAIEPGLYEAELNLALSLVRTRNAAAAIPHFRDAATKKPQEFRPTLGLAQALLEINDPPAAEQAFKRALALNAKSAAAEAGLGMALGRQNKVDEAAAHFQQAFTLDRTYRSTFVELAMLYEANHRTEEAITFYRMFPDNATALEHLGNLLTQAGDTKGAVATLQALVEKMPTTERRILLAQAYVADKQPAKAEAAIAPAVEAAPKDIELRMFYGRLLRDQRKFPAAAAQFSEVTALNPALVEAWNELANVDIVGEQYQQGLAALERVRALGKETPGNLFYRALAQDHLQMRPEAVESYEKFLAGAGGEFPDQEFQARQRIRILKAEIQKRR